nr:hypothetical protein [Roseivivax sediminis]
MALALCTGQRRADLVVMGKQRVRDGSLTFTQHKGWNRQPVRMEIPVIPEQRHIIDATPTCDPTILVSTFNRPFTSKGFGNRSRTWRDEAGPPQCSFHELRNTAAARLAELGRIEQRIMAITGQATSNKARLLPKPLDPGKTCFFTRTPNARFGDATPQRRSEKRISGATEPLPRAVGQNRCTASCLHRAWYH